MHQINAVDLYEVKHQLQRYTDLRPYSVVENAGFRYTLNVLEPRYSIPSRKRLREEMIPRREVKGNISLSLQSADRVTLTCDGWTSRSQDSDVTITCHCSRDDWVLVSNVSQTRALQTAVKPAAVQEYTVKPATIDFSMHAYYSDYGSFRNNTERTRLQSAFHLDAQD
ncbi:zinc finger BED domain-containing 1-like protein [Labeo rohita]|uniref:Zinc finger BED domain-containing 1-like protein n=1 Tax=Labeo rohita TaxID=84645 RepID=A0A498M540_LABRO|nr:zinc finger BED domain-containing 1-like protein [Labeo rohita]